MFRCFVALALVFAGTVACKSSDDIRCNAQNCSTLTGCGLALVGSGDIGYCSAQIQDAGTSFDASGAASQLCVNACNENSQGALLNCVATNFAGDTCAEILDGGGQPQLSVEAACETPPAAPPPAACESNCMACQSTCLQTQRTCDVACQGSSGAAACFSCVYSCGQNRFSCYAACPTN